MLQSDILEGSEAMWRSVCLLVLVLGIQCNNDGGGSADMGVSAPPRLCSPDKWCWENPRPQGNTLNGLWGTDPNNVWAVGDSGTIL